MSVSTLPQYRLKPNMVVNKHNDITVITRDNIRVLHPHGTKKHKPPVVLRPDEMNRIKMAASFLSTEQEQEREAMRLREKVAQAEAALERRHQMERLDRRGAHTEISDVERDAKDKANYLLSKAQSQRDEEEDDIKRVNQLILNAKCVAIRESQVEEKGIIRKETKKEEQRLDAMMELARQEGLKQAEEKRLARKADMHRGALVIQQQIAERREASLLEAERRDQETKATLAALSRQAETEKAELVAKFQAQQVLMHQVAAANAEAINIKKDRKLKDQEEDRRLLKYLVDKEKLEVEKDHDLQARKAEREKDLSRLRAAQKKATDKLADQDSLRAKRAYEAYEREWRRKELETMEKKAEAEANLRQERAKQHAARESAISVEARHLRTEFLDNLRELQAKEAKIKQHAQFKHEQNQKYCIDLKKQILERQAIKNQERQQYFLDRVALESGRREKKSKLDAIRCRKLSELRALNVPEKFCKEVERKLSMADRPGRLAAP